MNRCHALVVAVAVLTGTPALAAPSSNFSCRNEIGTIDCSASACAATGSVVYMDITRSGGTLRVCAGTGCWSGPLDLIRVRGDLTLLHARLSTGEGAALIHNRRTRTATLMWGDFVQPLHCGDGA